MKKFTAAIILSALMLTACSGADKSPVSSEPAGAYKAVGSLEAAAQTPADITLDKYAVPTVYNEQFAAQFAGTALEEIESAPLNMMYFADAADAVYYIYDCQHAAVMSTAFDIYRLDKASGESALAGQLRFEAQTALFSCVSSDSALYFSLYNTDGLWQVCEFSFADGAVTVLKEGRSDDEPRVPCLTYADGKLAWYSQNGSAVDLITLDPESGAENAVQGVVSSNPYERTAGLAYALDENGEAVVYSGTQRICTGAASGDFSLAAAQDGRVAWYTSDKSGGRSVHFIDAQSGSEYSEVVNGCMGAGVIGGYFYIHTNDGAVKLCDLAGGKSYVIADAGSAWAYPLGGGRLGISSGEELCVITAQ